MLETVTQGTGSVLHPFAAGCPLPQGQDRHAGLDPASSRFNSSLNYCDQVLRSYLTYIMYGCVCLLVTGVRRYDGGFIQVEEQSHD
jgi:hypothetical protein